MARFRLLRQSDGSFVDCTAADQDEALALFSAKLDLPFTFDDDDGPADYWFGELPEIFWGNEPLQTPVFIRVG